MNSFHLLAVIKAQTDEISQNITQITLKSKAVHLQKQDALKKKVIESLKTQIENTQHKNKVLKNQNDALKCLTSQMHILETPLESRNTQELDFYKEMGDTFSKLRNTQVDIHKTKWTCIDELNSKIEDGRKLHESLQEDLTKQEIRISIAENTNKDIISAAEQTLDAIKKEENESKVDLDTIITAIDSKLCQIQNNNVINVRENQRLKEMIHESDVTISNEMEQIDNLINNLRKEEETSKTLTTKVTEMNANNAEFVSEIISAQNQIESLRNKLKTNASNIYETFGIDGELHKDTSIQNYVEACKHIKKSIDTKIIQEENELQEKTQNLDKQLENTQRKIRDLNNVVISTEEQIERVNKQIFRNAQIIEEQQNIEITLQDRQMCLDKLEKEQSAIMEASERQFIAAGAAILETKSFLNNHESIMQEKCNMFMQSRVQLKQDLDVLRMKRMRFTSSLYKAKIVKEQLSHIIAKRRVPK